VSIFLGIDGGGTKTSCLVGDENAELGRGVGGPSNVIRVGEGPARDSLTQAITQACASAQVNPKDISRTCIGMAGGARPQVAQEVKKIASEIVAGKVEVVGDMVIALEAAFHGGPGVVVIAGTGSIAYGRNVAGETARAGGWGFAISDEGSAHWIGRTVMTHLMRAYDEGLRKPLLERLMKVWNASTMDQMIIAANAPSADFPMLFPAIVAAAEEGETLVCEVLAQAGSELAMLASAVVLRVLGKGEAVRVAMAGGVFRNAAAVRRAFYNELQRLTSEIQFNDSVVEPVEGALWLARGS